MERSEEATRGEAARGALALRARAARALGILGGSFDPPHAGHLFVARAAARAFALEHVVLVPAARPPHKPSRVLAAARDRVAMLELLIADDPDLSLWTGELDRAGPSYTYDTVLRLREAAHPEARLHLLMGGDNLAGLAGWHEAEALLALVQPIVVVRRGSSLAASATGLSEAARERIQRGAPGRRAVRRQLLRAARGAGPRRRSPGGPPRGDPGIHRGAGHLPRRPMSTLPGLLAVALASATACSVLVRLFARLGWTDGAGGPHAARKLQGRAVPTVGGPAILVGLALAAFVVAPAATLGDAGPLPARWALPLAEAVGGRPRPLSGPGPRLPRRPPAPGTGARLEARRAGRGPRAPGGVGARVGLGPRSGGGGGAGALPGPGRRGGLQRAEHLRPRRRGPRRARGPGLRLRAAVDRGGGGGLPALQPRRGAGPRIYRGLRGTRARGAGAPGALGLPRGCGEPRPGAAPARHAPRLAAGVAAGSGPRAAGPWSARFGAAAPGSATASTSSTASSGAGTRQGRRAARFPWRPS